jgi:ketosteroid isomerase-like protein
MLSRTLDSLDVEVHGDIALTTGRIKVTREHANPVEREYTVRYARIYVRRDGRWIQLTHHSTGETRGR